MAMYGGPGMMAYSYYPTPAPIFDTPPHHPYLLGYLPMPDGSQQPIFTAPYLPAFGQQQSLLGTDIAGLEASFESLSINQAAQDPVPVQQKKAPLTFLATEPQRFNKVAPRPGRGFFSTGRGEIGSWKSRSVNSSSNAIIPADNSSRSEVVRRTVYITDVDQQVTEAHLATFFQKCGKVKDCRVCGDPNSAMRFAFIEFEKEDAAKEALTRSGTVLGEFPLRILPSKTAIVPVNSQYLPKSVSEREKVVRTIYAANIDKKVDRKSVKAFFETLCGPVTKIRLLGDWQHTTRIAFVEFVHTHSAMKALTCSGALLGSLPVRVSPSKTPVRDDPQGSNERIQGPAQ